MKKAFTNIILTLTIVLNSQVVPQAFNYQGIARDASGNSLSAKQLGVRITLQEKNGNTTTDVYSETHSVTTNIFGLFNISIGRGISSLGNFSTVNFASKNISVKTEIDPNGGSNYTLNGNSELLSVPYALVAGNAGNSTNYWNKNIVNNFLYVNTNEKIGIGTDAPNATLDLVGTAKFGTLATSTTNTKLLTADASGNLAFRDLSTISALSSPWTKNSSNNTVYVNNGERVGIGTNSPGRALDIVDNASGNARNMIAVHNSNTNNDGSAVIVLTAGDKNQGWLGLTHHSPFYTLTPGFDNISAVEATGRGLALKASNSTGFLSFITGGPYTENEKMRIMPDGKIGIGTTTPSATLDLVGTAKFGTLTSSTTNTKLLTADASGNLAFRDLSTISTLSSSQWSNIIGGIQYNSGNVFIGDISTNKTTPFVVSKNTTGAERTLGVFENTNNTDKSAASIGVQSGTGTNLVGVGLFAYAKSYFPTLINSGCAGIVAEKLQIMSQPPTNSSEGLIKFVTGGNATTDANGGVERMRITYDGNIGMGTQAPKTQLHISQGDVYIDDATKGIIMKSPNGQCWRVTVSNTGGFTSTSITCP